MWIEEILTKKKKLDRRRNGDKIWWPYTIMVIISHAENEARQKQNAHGNQAHGGAALLECSMRHGWLIRGQAFWVENY